MDMVAPAPKGAAAAGEAQASPSSPPSSKRRSQNAPPPSSDVERKNEPAKAWVLVVDDEPELLRGVCRGLKMQGYSVTEARNGEEAVQHLSRRAFDVVVSDIVMPGMGGIQLLKEIRQHDLHVPVVLMTGAPAVSTAVQALEYGAFHYLTKPVEPESLDQIVQKAVRMHRMARVKQQAAELLGHAGALGADRAGLEASFDRAMQSMWIAYRPIVDVRKQQLFGYEALLRSTEPSLPHPGAVIDAAMRLGRLELLGRSIRSLAAEPIPATQDFSLFVNLHVTDLTDPALSDPESPLSKIAHRVVLEITDTGIGMSSERLSSLSQPFAYGDAALTRDHEGAGLGLAIARTIAELSGGRLTIDSRQGLGTTVAVSLPLHQSALRIDAAA